MRNGHKIRLKTGHAAGTHALSDRAMFGCRWVAGGRPAADGATAGRRAAQEQTLEETDAAA